CFPPVRAPQPPAPCSPLAVVSSTSPVQRGLGKIKGCCTGKVCAAGTALASSASTPKRGRTRSPRWARPFAANGRAWKDIELRRCITIPRNPSIVVPSQPLLDIESERRPACHQMRGEVNRPPRWVAEVQNHVQAGPGSQLLGVQAQV